AEELGEIMESAVLGEHQLLAGAELLGLEERLPGEPGRKGEQLLLAARVVDGLHVAALLDRPLDLRRRGLERHDVARLGRSVARAAEGEQLRDVGDVLAAQLLELRIVLEVVVAVGKAERRLADKDT